ncbi:hypothetical protein TELCIR_09336 [Teladorsagia circumcincta]|uniref:Uncharacterized protein n=1 Tax=Teladorsagia circumcincta TaxID=45464 RepID=A0A2G9UH90_TELCI|nr:hypothetical protein TELCIR_09336 [Teladorsagia circumcincta]
MRVMPGTSSLFMGGDQKKLIQFDLEKQKELRVASIKEKNANLIRLNGSQLFTSDSEGKNGQAQMMFLNERNAGVPVIIDSGGYQLTTFDFSTTKQYLAFGDEIGNIHVYADRPNPAINDSSYETDFADPSRWKILLHLLSFPSFTVNWRFVVHVVEDLTITRCLSPALGTVFRKRNALWKEVGELKDHADMDKSVETGRSYCKYSHGTDDWDLECASWLEDTGCGDWKHFVNPAFNARVANGLAILSEKPMEGEYDRYELVGIVAAIGDGNGQWTHSVTLIKDDTDS